MLSRSAITKVEALFIIDMIIVAIAAGSYFYFDSQGLLAAGPKLAEFTATDLIINPLEAEAGEPILISVNMTNIGDLEGNYSVDFTINDVLKENQTIQLAAGESTIVEFTNTENTEGNYTVKIDGLSGSFKIKPASPETSKIILANLKIEPYETWVDEPITATVNATNIGAETDSLSARLMVDGAIVETKRIELAAGATTTVEFTFTATSEGTHSAKVNTLTGSFIIVPTGYHTLTIMYTGGQAKKTPMPFTMDGESLIVPYSELVPVGAHTLSVPTTFQTATAYFQFSYWSDGVETATRTIDLQSRTILVLQYKLVSGTPSCPSLFTWNGTNYVYRAEISAGTGYLPYFIYFGENRTRVFGYSDPWDYIKLDNSQIQPKAGSALSLSTQLPFVILIAAGIALLALSVILIKNGKGRGKKLMIGTLLLVLTILLLISQVAGFLPFASDTFPSKGVPVQNDYYDMTLTEFNDEISYTDSVRLLVVDHSPDVDVYSTYGTRKYNLDERGTIYTVSKNQSPPVSAVYSGQDVLAQISKLDGVYANISDWKYGIWNTLELDLGDLSNAQEVKLTVAGMVAWPSSEVTVEWTSKFVDRPGEPLFPVQYMEVKDENGNWVPVPDNRQFPMLRADSQAFVVNLTGLFPTNDYSLRINTFFDWRFDYIGVDTTSQQDMSIQEIYPVYANLTQVFEPEPSYATSTGNFTRYGDVTELLLEADNKFVIIRQGDEVHLLFPASIEPVPEGMERDYFVVVSCWFKLPGLPYLPFTVDPLPFHAMSAFPYPDTESYPHDEDNLTYLAEYNTRAVTTP